MTNSCIRGEAPNVDMVGGRRNRSYNRVSRSSGKSSSRGATGYDSPLNFEHNENGTNSQYNYHAAVPRKW